MKHLLSLCLCTLLLIISCKKEIMPSVESQLNFAELLKQQQLPDDVRETPKKFKELQARTPPKVKGINQFSGKFCIFVDANGGTYTYNQTWFPTPTVYNSANLTAQNQTDISTTIYNRYSEFDVLVTYDENVYNTYAVSHRTRVNLIDDSQTNYFLNSLGGISYIETITMSFEEPCWVFADNLAFDMVKIADAVVHEAGHTIGLSHKSQVSNCTLVNAYQYPIGSAPISFCSNMGVPYGASIKSWTRGYTPYYDDIAHCYTTQDEYAKLNQYLDYKADANVNTIAGGNTYVTVPFGFTYNGTLEQTSDVDILKLPTFATTLTKTINVDVYGTLDVRLDFYTSVGALYQTLDPSGTPDIHQSGIVLTTAMSGGYVKISPSTNNPNIPSPTILTGKWKYSTQ